jgi:hypothetical protein
MWVKVSVRRAWQLASSCCCSFHIACQPASAYGVRWWKSLATRFWALSTVDQSHLWLAVWCLVLLWLGATMHALCDTVTTGAAAPQIKEMKQYSFVVTRQLSRPSLLIARLWMSSGEYHGYFLVCFFFGITWFAHSSSPGTVTVYCSSWTPWLQAHVKCMRQGPYNEFGCWGCTVPSMYTCLCNTVSDNAVLSSQQDV